MTGSDFSPVLDSVPLELWHAYAYGKGQVLSFSTTKNGARTYLAVRGGWEVPKVMGSRSTLLPARLGGFEGRALKAGDRLAVGKAEQDFVPGKSKSRYFRFPIVTKFGLPGERIGMSFRKGVKESLVKSDLAVTNDSNRSGLRLTGLNVSGTKLAERITEVGHLGNDPASPPSGEPLVLMPDQQTTGGYPEIGPE